MGKYIKDSEIYLPDINETNWGTKVNKNFEILNNVKTSVKNNSTAINRMESDIANNRNRLESLSDVPTKLSELENDTGFLTSASLPTVPTKLSQLENDSGYITSASLPNVPSKLSQLENDVGFVTGSVSGNNLFDVYEKYLDAFLIQVSKTPVLDSSIQGSTDSSTLDNVKFKSVEDVLCNLNVYTYLYDISSETDIIGKCNFTFIGDDDSSWYFAMPFRSIANSILLNAYNCNPTSVELLTTDETELKNSGVKISQKIMSDFQTKIIVDELFRISNNPLFHKGPNVNFVIEPNSKGQVKFKFIKPKYGYIV